MQPADNDAIPSARRPQMQPADNDVIPVPCARRPPADHDASRNAGDSIPYVDIKTVMSDAICPYVRDICATIEESRSKRKRMEAINGIYQSINTGDSKIEEAVDLKDLNQYISTLHQKIKYAKSANARIVQSFTDFATDMFDFDNTDSITISSEILSGLNDTVLSIGNYILDAEGCISDLRACASEKQSKVIAASAEKSLQVLQSVRTAVSELRQLHD